MTEEEMFDREVASIEQDLANGLITKEEANRQYRELYAYASSGSLEEE